MMEVMVRDRREATPYLQLVKKLTSIRCREQNISTVDFEEPFLNSFVE